MMPGQENVKYSNRSWIQYPVHSWSSIY